MQFLNDDVIENQHRTIEQIEEFAKTILQVKKKSRKRPVVIEFCGTPKSGKTSSILSLNTFLKRNDYKTKIITENANICPITNKYNPNFNFWNLFRTSSELIELYSEQYNNVDVIICDRGYFDCLVWFKWFELNRHISAADYETIERLISMNHFAGTLDIVLALTVDPAIALKREYVNLLTKKHGRIMNESVLNDYNQCLKEVINNEKFNYRTIVQKSSNDIDQSELNKFVTMLVLEKINELLNEKIAYIAKEDLQINFQSKFTPKISFLPEITFGFLERSIIEDDLNKVQIVAVAAIIDKKTNRIFRIKKKKELTPGDTPEADRHLFYISGHVRKEDQFKKNINLLDMAKYCIERELKEEIGISANVDKDDLLLIWDTDIIKSSKHLAIVFPYFVDESLFTPRINITEFEIDKSSGIFVSINDNEIENMEFWSQVIVNHYIRARPIQRELF